jgi:hypothetical protein
MAGLTAPRFKSREAALRFYFRASELLKPNASPGIFSSIGPPRIHDGPHLIRDLSVLDSCFDGMNEVHLWLLRELYRPGCFNPRPRPLGEIFEAVRSQFPKLEWTPQRITQFKREALKIFEAHLQRERLM